MGQVGVDVVSVGLVEVPPVVEELEPDHAPTRLDGLVVGDAAGLADGDAGGFRGGESDEEAEMSEALAEAEEWVHVTLTRKRDHENMKIVLKWTIHFCLLVSLSGPSF